MLTSWIRASFGFEWGFDKLDGDKVDRLFAWSGDGYRLGRHMMYEQYDDRWEMDGDIC